MKLQDASRGIGVVLLLAFVAGCVSGPVNCDRRLEPINPPTPISADLKNVPAPTLEERVP